MDKNSFQIGPIGGAVPVLRREFPHLSSIGTGLATDVLGQPDKGAAVIIATRGRADIVRGLIGRLGHQTLPPAHIFVVGSQPSDLAGLERDHPQLTIHLGRTGSALQRNDGLALAGERFSYIVFFDDDFIPSRFWLKRMRDVFEVSPDIAGVTGIVLADGAATAGIALDAGRAMVERRDAIADISPELDDRFGYGGNMGCNMAFRFSAMKNIVFDECLPLYAWLEDADFRGQVSRQGRIVRASSLWGVHLGHKPGRGRGVTLGYSQIANPLYLAKKGTIPIPFLVRGIARNLISNAVRSLSPEPFIDRRGRLKGNMIALADIARGRIRPERVLTL